MKRNRILAASSVVILILVIVLSPSAIPYTIYSTSLVMPVSEWTLSRAQNGNLTSTLKDNRTGRLSAYSASVFQRGYQANFQLNPNIYHRPYLHQGDTVATMYSNQDEERLIQLQGDLQVQQAELQLYSSGGKATEVETMANQIALAQQELATQRSLTARTQVLYQDSLTSQQEYEMALNQLRIRELNLKTAQTNYQSTATGGKPEQLQVILTRIRSLQRQIHQIQNGLKDLTLTAPVSGTVLFKKAAVNPMEEVLLSVADNSAYVVLMPVDYLEKEYVQVGQPVQVAIKGTTRMATGRIVGIDNTVQIVDGRQALFVTALVEEQNLPLVPGMFVKTTILCQSITLKEHLGRSFKLLFIY